MALSSGTVQIDAETQRLLGTLVRQGIFEFKPTLSEDGVHYVEIEKYLEGSDPSRVKGMLEDLERKGVLKSEALDRILVCPCCGSPKAQSKYVCPRCGSYNVEIEKLIEHNKCGYIGAKSKFMRGSFLVCPSCQAELENSRAVSHREIGSGYQCEKCGYRFDKPEVVHICQNCRRVFTYRDASYVKIFSFKINEETVDALLKDLPIIEHVKNILINKGFKVQLQHKMTGISGVQHSFDIVAEKDETRIVIDVSLEGAKKDLISLLTKKVDVNADSAIIIDLSNSDELSSVGKAYNIAVLKTTSDHELSSLFENLLATLNPRLMQEKKTDE